MYAEGRHVSNSWAFQEGGGNPYGIRELVALGQINEQVAKNGLDFVWLMLQSSTDQRT